MKVLHFCMSHGWGGLEMASAQWAGLFERHGFKSHSITSPGSPLTRRLHELGLPTVEMKFRRYHSPVQSWRLRQYIIENDIDAVFLQTLKDLWVVSPALIGLPTRLVGFAQMWLEGIDKKDMLHKMIHRRMDRLVALTPRQRDQVLRCIPYDKEKTVIIPNSIDPSRFSPGRRSDELRTSFGAGAGDVLLGIVGRLDPQKGQKEAIEGFAHALKMAPSLPLKMVVVGEPTAHTGSAYLDELKATAKTLGVESRVHFAGFRSDIPDVMASLDVFLLNSYREAFGFVIVEAMMSGTAVIATNSGGVPDVLGDGRYGLLIPARDNRALADAYVGLAKNDEFRREISEKARAYALSEYDENVNFNKMLDLLKSIPSRRS